RARPRAGFASSCDLQDDLSRAPRADRGEGLVDPGEGELVRDDGARVEESRRQVAAHVVPRLVHFPADDAVDGDALEDDLAGEVHRHGVLGNAEQLDAAAHPHGGECLVPGVVMYWANAPSRSTPMMRVLRQMCPLPVRHWRQWSHTMCPSAVTSCPTFRSATSSTPSPMAAISPANSCPTTTGGLIRCCAQSSQSAMCRSVPHTPAWRTAISTSPGPAVGLGTVVTFRPGAGLSLTTACM